MDRSREEFGRCLPQCGTQKWNGFPSGEQGEDCSHLVSWGETRSWQGERPGRREGTSSALGAVTDSSPVSQETLYTEPWETQLFVDWGGGGGGGECKLDFKASIWLKLEAMGLICCRLWQEKWLIASEFLPHLIIVVTRRSLTWWSKHETNCLNIKLSSASSDL